MRRARPSLSLFACYSCPFLCSTPLQNIPGSPEHMVYPSFSRVYSDHQHTNILSLLVHALQIVNQPTSGKCSSSKEAAEDVVLFYMEFLKDYPEHKGWFHLKIICPLNHSPFNLFSAFPSFEFFLATLSSECVDSEDGFRFL